MLNGIVAVVPREYKESLKYIDEIDEIKTEKNFLGINATEDNSHDIHNLRLNSVEFIKAPSLWNEIKVKIKMELLYH